MLFPALTGLEFMSHHVDKQARLVVKVRPSVNHNSLTIEKVLSKMRDSHLQLLDLLTDNLRFAGIPPPALQPLLNLKVHAEQRDPTWFNNTRNYRKSTTDAIEVQSDVFRSLTDRGASAERGLMLTSDKMKTAALLAAQVGEAELAVELLLRRKKQQYLGEPTVAALEKIVDEILGEGCKQPWPQTLAKLISQETFGNKDAAIPPDRVVEILKKSLASSAYDSPFHVGARVRVCEKMHGASPWLNARIKGERRGTATYKKTIQGKQRVETSGIEYSVEMDGGGLPRWVPEERVVAPTQHGLPAVLHVAATSGDVEVVKMLLDAKVSLYATDLKLNTALVLAALGARPPQFVKVTSTNIDATMPHVQTAKSSGALVRSKTAIFKKETLRAAHVQHSVELGVSSDKMDEAMEKYQKQCEVVEHLCHRLDVPLEFRQVRNIKRQNAFDVSVNNRASRVVRTINDNQVQQLVDDDLMFKNADALRKGRLNHLQRLGSGEAQVSPLMMACRAPAFGMELKEAEEIVKKLLDDGADVHYRDGKFQLNALHVAAEEGYDSIVDLLLRSNATTYVDQQSQDGKTPLFMAVCSGHVDVANLLIGAGADVNYVRRGRTLLSNACQYGHKSVAYRLLVCAQEQENKEGRKRGSLALNKLCFEQGDETRQQLCINIASRYGHVDIVSMLLEEGVNLHWELENDAYTTSLHRACGAGHTYSGRLLLKKAAKAAPSYADRLVNHQDPKGLTALHYAAGGGNSEAVLLLLDEFPCDPNLRNNSGETAIFAAAKAGQEETVAILCRYADRKEGPRVEIDTTANDGQSPLTIAAANGHAGVVRILCLHNAKQPIESDEAQDPLMLAVKSANLAIVKALTAHLSKRLLARHPHKLLKEVKRLERAMAAAKEKETAKKEEGDDQEPEPTSESVKSSTRRKRGLRDRRSNSCMQRQRTL